MRNAKDPNHPPGGSTKINGQVAQHKTKTVTANIAHKVKQTVEIHPEDDDCEDAHSDCFDETAMFLAGVLGDQTDVQHEYTTTQTTAMMMENESLLLDDETESKAPLRVPSTHEVPRLSLDANQGGRIHVNVEDNIESLLQSSSSSVDLPSYPTQAAQAAPIRGARSCASLISSPQTGASDDDDNSLGGGEVEDELEEIVPRTY